MKKSNNTAADPIEKPGVIQTGAVMLFLALFAFPLYPLKLANGILIAFYVATAVAYFAKPVPIGKPLLRNLIFFIPFLPYFIEAAVNGFAPAPLFETEKKLFFYTAHLILPIFFAATKFRNYKLALLIFSVSVALQTVYGFGALLAEGSLSSGASMGGSQLLRDHFESVTHIHPTYYSVFALLAAAFFIQASLHVQIGYRILMYLIAVIMIVVVFILAARIAFIIAGAFFIIWLIVWKAPKIRKGIVSGVAAGVMVAAVFLIPSLNERFREMSSWTQGRSPVHNTFSQRITIMECALEVFGDHLLLGTSATGSQAALNDCYVSKGMPLTPDRSYNPHNQYLSLGINYGIFVLLIFLAALFLLFRKIFRTPEGLYFGVAIVLVFMTESILDRQLGVFCFGLIGMLLYNTTREKTVNIDPTP